MCGDEVLSPITSPIFEYDVEDGPKTINFATLFTNTKEADCPIMSYSVWADSSASLAWDESLTSNLAFNGVDQVVYSPTL